MDTKRTGGGRNTYQAWSPKRASPHREDRFLSGPWKAHWQRPSASSAGNTIIKGANNSINTDLKSVDGDVICDHCTCFFHSGWTLLQYLMTVFRMCSVCRCSEACGEQNLSSVSPSSSIYYYYCFLQKSSKFSQSSECSGPPDMN